jgi:hypothetical protein
MLQNQFNYTHWDALDDDKRPKHVAILAPTFIFLVVNFMNLIVTQVLVLRFRTNNSKSWTPKTGYEFTVD